MDSNWLEEEMKEFYKQSHNEPLDGAIGVKAPSGYQTIVSRRFSKWFIPRNPGWVIEAL